MPVAVLDKVSLTAKLCHLVIILQADSIHRFDPVFQGAGLPEFPGGVCVFLPLFTPGWAAQAARCNL